MPLEERVDAAVIQSFEMPQVLHGDTVAWYPSGMRSQSPETAQVIRVSARNVHLVTATRGVREAVRHIDDPKLRLNADQREMGAWDFTAADKARKVELAMLREEVDVLSRQVSGLISGSSPKRAQTPESNTARSVAVKAYHELRRKVIAKGVKVTGNPTKEWLQQQLEE